MQCCVVIKIQKEFEKQLKLSRGTAKEPGYTHLKPEFKTIMYLCDNCLLRVSNAAWMYVWEWQCQRSSLRFLHLHTTVVEYGSQEEPFHSVHAQIR